MDGKAIDPLAAQRLAARYDPGQVPAGARRDLLDRVPREAAVLDVGCWSGFAGRYLAESRAAAVDGVEPEPAMAEQARAGGYREVLATTAEAALAQLAGAGRRYDAVLFLDVLEHLVDPAAVLRDAAAVLEPDGRLLVSIPNVAHWWVRKELLRGRFEYADHGILDRTHLRFFTFETAEALLTGAGWQVTWRSASMNPPLMAGRALRVFDRWPKLFASQALFEARRTTSR